ncbi:hypothetical protein E4U23_002669 [Claviceps purpurea]|nr:hypothetical protein E4U23_002669 [Claviceps purpurea]
MAHSPTTRGCCRLHVGDPSCVTAKGDIDDGPEVLIHGPPPQDSPTTASDEPPLDHRTLKSYNVRLPHRSRGGQYAIESYGHTLLFTALRYTTLAPEATTIGLKSLQASPK